MFPFFYSGPSNATVAGVGILLTGNGGAGIPDLSTCLNGDEPLDFEKYNQDGTAYRVEHVHVGKELKLVRRLYAASMTYHVGWVLDDDVSICMICTSDFGIFNWKHHCRACGYLVCAGCSPYRVPIEEFMQVGEPESRVCINCFGFRNRTFVKTHEKKRSIVNGTPTKPIGTIDNAPMTPWSGSIPSASKGRRKSKVPHGGNDPRAYLKYDDDSDEDVREARLGRIFPSYYTYFQI